MARSARLHCLAPARRVAIVILLTATMVQSQTVKTVLGLIRGTYCQGSNSTVAKFMGIPFAKPPVGPLRWTAPKKYTQKYPSSGLVATRPKAACVQGQTENISEDCLYLNVWMPAAATNTSKLPVRVFFHGGNFVSGSGIDNGYDGCHVVIDGSVVSVTVNYRLGILGFLALPQLKDSAASGTTGNWGLLDQRLALQWVQENIASFGGDPKRVMIYGESSGGTSVYYHTVMPKSRGLFAKAIMQSPDADFASMFLKDAYMAGNFITGVLGCDTATARQRGYSCTEACLRDVNTTVILDAQSAFNSIFGIDLSPAVDGTQEAFPKHPYELMTKGKVANVPTMVGSNSNEGALFVIGYMFAQGIPVDGMTKQDFINFIRPFGRVPQSFLGRLLKQYDPAAYGSYFIAAIVAAGDTNYYCPMLRVAKAFSKQVPTYAYFLQQVKPNSGCGSKESFGIELPPDQLDFMAAYHAYDLQFVFGAPYATRDVNGGCNYTANETQMASFMSGVWSNFAAKGTPLPPRTKRLTAPQLRQVKDWPRWTPTSPRALNLEFTQPVAFDFNAAVYSRCKIWDDMLAAALKAGTNFPELYPSATLSPPRPVLRDPPRRQQPVQLPPSTA